MLKPGEYQLVVDDTSVTFLRDGKEVAKSPAVLQEGSEKFYSNEMVTSGDHSLKEICLGGTNTKLVLK